MCPNCEKKLSLKISFLILSVVALGLFGMESYASDTHGSHDHSKMDHSKMKKGDRKSLSEAAKKSIVLALEANEALHSSFFKYDAKAVESNAMKLKKAIDASGLSYSYNPGEGAFYGPKLEFVLRDAIGRDWQCGTLQVDLNLPERLSANYIGEDGSKHFPVMLHRALFGSLERFIGILLEHHAGRLPLWLAPIQIVIANITSSAESYAKEIFELFKQNSLRTELDTRNEKIGYKIREHSTAKIPILFIIGNKEMEEKTISIRRLGSDKTETLSIEDSLSKLLDEAKPPGSIA